MSTSESEDKPDLRTFWGKAGQAKNAIPHPLICHMIDTGIVAESLYPMLVGPRCQAELAKAFAAIGDPRAWTAYFCGLHDLGKLSPAFQSLRTDIAEQGLPEVAAAAVRRVHKVKVPGKRTDTPHGELTSIHLDRMLRAWGAPGPTAQAISDAVGGHHGVFAGAAVLQQARDKINHHGGKRWAAWVDAMAEELANTLGLPAPAGLPWKEVRLSPVGAVALAGLTVISDWLASDMASKEPAGPDVDLSTYPTQFRERVEQRLEALRWRAWQPPEDTSFRKLFESEPRPLQDLVEKISSEVSRPAIVVIEAPTGEGKTKAALQCTATLVRRFELAGFYLAMPTRATANQAFTEARDMVDKEVPVMLLHGTATEYLSTADRLKTDPERETLTPADVGIDEAKGAQDKQAREWFTKRKAQVMPVGVGTVDRVQQAAIRSRFVALPLVGFSNRVVIVDEVHSYDTYMSMTLDRALWWLGRLGVSVVLLSATLATARRDELIRQWLAGVQNRTPDQVSAAYVHDPDAPNSGNPRVTVADESGVRARSCMASELNRNRTIRLRHLDDAELVDTLLDLAAAGQSVAVIRNTRSRARETRAAISREIEALPPNDRPKLLFLTAEVNDRNDVERQLTACFGPAGERPPGAIVVGTGLLGLSLDLDFDAMVSDLAPIDVLIQRAGRLHRFRPITRPPLLALTGVTETRSGPTFGKGIHGVYRRWILLRTWALLRERTELHLPDEAASLIDAVYGPADAITFPTNWRKLQQAAQSWYRSQNTDKSKARIVYLRPPPRSDVAGNFLRSLTFHPKSSARTRLSRGPFQS